MQKWDRNVLYWFNRSETSQEHFMMPDFGVTTITIFIHIAESCIFVISAGLGIASRFELAK